MNASKTILTAGVFGVVAAFSPASADETKYNFSSELSQSEAGLRADGRVENVRRGYVAARPTGPEVGEFNINGFGRTIKREFENFGHTIHDWFQNHIINPPKHTDATRPFGRAWRTKDLSILRDYNPRDYDRDGRLIANRPR